MAEPTKGTTYKVVTPAKTVYIYNVTDVRIDSFTIPDDGIHDTWLLVFERAGLPVVHFLFPNVLSYEEVPSTGSAR